MRLSMPKTKFMLTISVLLVLCFTIINVAVAQAQTLSINYITVLAEDSGDTGTELTVTWNDTGECSSDYKAYLKYYGNYTPHLEIETIDPGGYPS